MRRPRDVSAGDIPRWKDEQPVLSNERELVEQVQQVESRAILETGLAEGRLGLELHVREIGSVRVLIEQDSCVAPQRDRAKQQVAAVSVPPGHDDHLSAAIE